MSAEQKKGGIAIVGMAGRFPKARNVDDFWRNLCDGVEGISFFSDEELEAAGIDFPKNNSNYVKARGFLDGADLFDANFFGVSPREAEIMDPQHRVFLECAWAVLENAGCNPEKFDGAIGVFAGVSMNTYLAHNLFSHPELVAQLNEHQLMLGNDKDFLPTRVSYKLNLRGPSLNIQTACSTSLVAVCVACQNLLNYECDAALAGAVSIAFPQKRGYLFQEGGIASPDGHCRAFDAKAAGTVAGEGVAIVALKRLEDALADGDTIYAVIKGFAINNDGANKIGYTAPSVEGQAEVIATAQVMAGFAPETISYIEAHGTGTPLGDPIEIEGLTKAFVAGTSKKNFCAVGSVKSNVGHLDTAAGVTGLIKTALALHHKKIPPSLHFESPNPKIDFANSPFFVNAKLAEWKNGEFPRRAGVSSFGIGGTNAHVVLEEAPALETPADARPAQLLLLSAKTEIALDKAAKNLAEHLKQNPAVNLADVAHTLQIGRREFSRRRMLVCRGAGDAANILATRDAKRIFSRVAETENPPVVFMFTGQGAQQVNMAIELYEHEIVFREQVDLCCEILKPHLGFDLRAVIYPELFRSDKLRESQSSKSGTRGTRPSDEMDLTQTAITQPALFVVEYALAKLWMSWGVQPEAMIGHSIGEYVAACLAGVFSLEDALALVAARGRMMQQLPAGTMLAVRLSKNEIKPLLNEKISLAAVNAPSLCVVSGSTDSIETFQRAFTERGGSCTPLQTSHAFHSAMMEPVLQPFAGLVGKVKLNAPQIPFISNVTGKWISDSEATNPNYWAKHLRQTVRFADGVSELLKSAERILLEVGPGQTLCSLAKQHPARSGNSVVVSSLHHAKDSASDYEILMSTLGRLWLSGVEIDWKNFYRHEQRRRIPLPAYPFERKRYFIEPAKSTARIVSSADEAPKFAEENAEVVPIHHLAAMPTTQPENQTATALRTLLAELSGLNPAAINDSATFAEMGFESLFLTQFSVTLGKKFGVNVAFRQLLQNFSTLDALAAHIGKSAGQKVENRNEAATKIVRNGPEDTMKIPLTESQRELWFASEMSDAASCAYNECRLLHLRGELKENTLMAAIQSLVERHEALRTTFAPGGDFQQVQTALKPDVPLLDWSKLSPDAQTAKLDALLHEEARQPFDLTAGPLLRAWVIRLDEEHHVLVLTVHHIVCDGHSLGILLRELAEIYSAECRGVHGELPAPLQWSEYARRQSQKNATRKADEQFWLNQFSADAPVLELPTDHPRSSTRTFEGAGESRLLPAALGAELKRIGAQRGGTLFTTLLASYAIWLHKLSGQDEVVVGIPIADRAVDGGESLVGHCINFLPLRLKFDSDETFESNLARAQKVFFEAHEHQGFTFGSLIQKLSLPRNASRMPLLSATFNTQRMNGELKFSDLETELVTNPHAFTHFDLGFNVTEIGGALQLDCRYNKNLFAVETVRRWLGHFQTLLENVAANPQQKISELPLLTEAERRQILFDWNLPQSNFLCAKCIHQLFEEQVERTPDAVAVTFENESVTYAELNRRANRLAHRLRALGVGPEVMVGLCLERSLEMVVAVLGILKAGGAYVPMDTAYPIERLKFILQDANVPLLVTQKSLLDHFKFEISNLKLLCVDDGFDSKNPAHDKNPKTEVRPENLAYVIYTSGSTGQPKGVMVTHENIARLFHATQPWYQFNDRDIWTFFHSVAFDFSVWEIWGALIYGGRLVVVPYLTSRSPEAFLELLAREKVTVLNQTPSAFRQLIQAGQRASKPPQLALRFVIFGGEALEMQSLKPWFERHGDQQPQLVNMYGITETTVHVTHRPLTEKDLDSGSVIGARIPDLQIYILDAHRQPVPVGVPGEMFVGGAGVARGYLNRPELTAEKFISNPFQRGTGVSPVSVGEADERGPLALTRSPDRRDACPTLYKTGDLARWLANGDIEFLGRADNQVKIRGHRIELGEIESALARHPAVRECIAIVREDLPGDKRLTAYVVADLDEAGVTFGELRDFLKAKLPDYMIPSAIVFLDALPLTQNGKVDRKSLPAPEQTRPELEESFAIPRTPVETALVEIWREVLHLERIGIYDNFFELGGHSLLMTQIISRLRESFQVELPMRKFFESPTIAELSVAIEELLADEISQLSDEEVRRLAHSAG